ncbi:uncharacterized protein NPIL_164211 [Nephila pilipes]|uniref:Uncharacterized protein n=1 Tax=Nephila pilipes TaxID=299642 RepID=A0A8X6NQM1_NEPPI|nr:uncharacterized protein NPIL_164211 [Nephila pilipes]
MHSNSRFLSERPPFFSVRSRNPRNIIRVRRRIKPEKNRVNEELTAEEFADTFSENDRIPSKRNRNLRDRRNEKMFPKRSATWKILRGLILILCISCFLYQSSKFCILYFSYPTTLSLAVTSPNVFIKPAFTFCNTGLINRTYFCNEYPNLCMKPSNLTQFCERYSFNCKGDTSNLMILKNEEKGIVNKGVLEALRYLHFSSNRSQNKGNLWSMNVTSNSQVKANRIFIRNIGQNVMCFSSNLHLDDGAEPDVLNLDSSRRRVRDLVNYFRLKMPAHEALSYWSHPFVIFSIHSPFIQDDISLSSNELLLGHRYEINIRLVS